MSSELDPIWKALADATRREILDLLRAGPRTTTDIVERFPDLTRFGVMKHIQVLRDAELINTRQDGRRCINSLNAVPIRRIYERWVSKYAEHWAVTLIGLKESLEDVADTLTKEISMKTTDYIRTGLELSGRLTLALIEDMKDAPLTFPTAKGGNHPLWILGHLALSEARIIQEIMLGRQNPLEHWKELFERGTQPVAEAARYPSFDQVLRAFQEVRAGTLKALETLTDADLDQPSKACPPDLQSFCGTVGQCFLLLGFHSMFHRGQVADSRRMAGRKPVFM